jgi:hypothetical protein
MGAGLAGVPANSGVYMTIRFIGQISSGDAQQFNADLNALLAALNAKIGAGKAQVTDNNVTSSQSNYGS